MTTETKTQKNFLGKKKKKNTNVGTLCSLPLVGPETFLKGDPAIWNSSCVQAHSSMRKCYAEQRSRHSASLRACLQMVERGAARHSPAPRHRFPKPIGLGASFDPDLVHKMVEAISTEAWARFHEVQR